MRRPVVSEWHPPTMPRPSRLGGPAEALSFHHDRLDVAEWWHSVLLEAPLPSEEPISAGRLASSLSGEGAERPAPVPLAPYLHASAESAEVVSFPRKLWVPPRYSLEPWVPPHTSARRAPQRFAGRCRLQGQDLPFEDSPQRFAVAQGGQLRTARWVLFWPQPYLRPLPCLEPLDLLAG